MFGHSTRENKDATGQSGSKMTQGPAAEPKPPASLAGDSGFSGVARRIYDPPPLQGRVLWTTGSVS